jgi:hypothetical protein
VPRTCRDYFRVPADARDLNYDKFVEQGEQKITEAVEYNSHNTERLDVDGMTAVAEAGFHAAHCSRRFFAGCSAHGCARPAGPQGGHRHCQFAAPPDA